MTVEPFTIPVEPEEAAWIRRRVEEFRFFEEPVDAGWRYGANRAYLEALRDYWLTSFDWPAAVERLNRHPHVRVEVEPGFRLHAIHRRSSRADARPLLIAHGWPGSIVEFDAIIDRLAEPESPDAPAFHVVAPSLPGYAWSDKPTSPIGPRGVAALYDRLMPALGYDRYLYQGGDWGCVIGGWIGLDSSAVDAIHLNGFGLRDQVLAMIKSGAIAAKSFERTPESVTITGNVGVVMGSERFTPTATSESGRLFGVKPLTRRYTNVYLREAGKWRFLARHANVVPQR